MVYVNNGRKAASPSDAGISAQTKADWNWHVENVRWLNHCETGAGPLQFGFGSPLAGVNEAQNSFLVQRTCCSCDMFLFAFCS
jgi:hypothetical protein